MADAGRPRKPLAVKEREGTVRQDRESLAEPEWPQGEGDAPVHLVGPALEEWERIVPLLKAQGLFPATAEREVAMGCWWYGQWVGAAQDIETHGRVYANDVGRLFANPAVAHAVQASAQYQTMCGRFGLDPASAGKVTAKPPKSVAEDELARVRAARRAAR